MITVEDCVVGVGQSDLHTNISVQIKPLQQITYRFSVISEPVVDTTTLIKCVTFSHTLHSS